MEKIFNNDNKGHITKKYPTFFGDALGLYDSVNDVNPRFMELYDKQVAFLWNRREVSMVQDRIDMLNAPKDLIDLMQLTISWQWALDSVVGRSIETLLGRHVTNSQAGDMISAWNFFERIHPQTYASIVEQTYCNPDSAILGVYEDLNIIARSENILKIFQECYDITDNMSLREKQKRIAKTLIGLYILETVSFMASFTVTFAIAETHVFQGIAKYVSLICRDEMLHQHMSLELINTTRYQDGWESIYDEIMPEMIEMLEMVKEQEKSWARYIFKNNQMVGLNAELLCEAVDYFATPIYRNLGIDGREDSLVFVNPVPHINDYIDTSLIQAANQEINNTKYQIGIIDDDLTTDIDLDFEI